MDDRIAQHADLLDLDLADVARLQPADDPPRNGAGNLPHDQAAVWSDGLFQPHRELLILPHRSRPQGIQEFSSTISQADDPGGDAEEASILDDPGALAGEEAGMISREQNELMTRVGPGTPAGTLLRNYWQPVALAVTAVDSFNHALFYAWTASCPSCRP